MISTNENITDTVDFKDGGTVKKQEEGKYLGCKINYKSGMRKELAKRR